MRLGDSPAFALPPTSAFRPVLRGLSVNSGSNGYRPHSSKKIQLIRIPPYWCPSEICWRETLNPFWGQQRAPWIPLRVRTTQVFACTQDERVARGSSNAQDQNLTYSPKFNISFCISVLRSTDSERGSRSPKEEEEHNGILEMWQLLCFLMVTVLFFSNYLVYKVVSVGKSHPLSYSASACILLSGTI